MRLSPAEYKALLKRAKGNNRSVPNEIREMLRTAEHQRDDKILQALHELAVDVRVIARATIPAPWTETVDPLSDRLNWNAASATTLRNNGNG